MNGKCLFESANKEDCDQTAHLCSLIKAFLFAISSYIGQDEFTPYRQGLYSATERHWSISAHANNGLGLCCKHILKNVFPFFSIYLRLNLLWMVPPYLCSF